MNELDFPFWLRANHFINLFCMFLLMRSGLQILSDHPKLYWNDHCTPGSEWLKFGNKRMPVNRLWTSMDEAEDVPSAIALPGGHHNLGAGRNWHFLIVSLWVLNGLSYVTLLFVTGQWRRLIPTRWMIIPEAWESFRSFATFQLPPGEQFNPYDPLQQLAYAVIVFLIAPLMVATGLCMSPAFIARFPWYPRLFGGRQAARSLHFTGLITLILYTITHVTLVLIVHYPHDIANMVLGAETDRTDLAIWLAVLGLLAVVLFHIGATLWTLHRQRQFQAVATAVVEPLMHVLFGRLRSRQRYTPADITPYMRINGYPPESPEYRKLAEGGFADWRLKVEGLVERPAALSLADLRALPRQEQITMHNCIQGWSGIVQWAGVQVMQVLELCRPLPSAQYIVFYAFMQEEYAPQSYYEAFSLKEMDDPQTILAYEMNWRPLPIPHGAPCRLRIETKVGYKMVKYLRSIELVTTLNEVGEGHGGYREDYQYYDKEAMI